MDGNDNQKENYILNDSNEERYNITNNSIESSNNKQKKAEKISLLLLRFRWLVIGIVLGVILSILLYIKIKDNIQTENNNKVESTKIDIKYLTGTINNMSDLITSELEYTGLVDFKPNEEKTKWWNKMLISEEFLMVYNARIEAGIDLSTVKLIEKDDKIIVNMPHSSIKFKKVDPESIETHDVKKAFIKGDGKKQLKEAIVEAENDVEKNVNLSKLLKNAEDQAETLIKGLIKEIVDKEVEFHYENDKQKIASESNFKG